jgi:ATP phosphoribosyltransferase
MQSKVKLVLPKGRQYEKVKALLADAGIRIKGADRNYRPSSNDPNLEIKLLKSQNIPQMVALGQHDLGFCGKDWIYEKGAEVETVLDLGFDPVRIVAAIPEEIDWEELKQRKLIAVSEYKKIACDYLDQQGINYEFIQAYGATEVFPPEDADLVIDNTSTGSTLKANRLKIVDKVTTSSTVMIANPKTMEDPAKRAYIEDLKLLISGVLAGRERVLLEMNCQPNALDTLVEMLPAMKSPTVAKLYREEGFAIKAAVLKSEVKALIPQLLSAGATDILELEVRKVIG